MIEPSLELRPSQSNWASLLDLALPALDYVFQGLNFAEHSPGQPLWTLGGGTAMALRINHRASDDIDIFVAGTPLRLFAPANNPASKMISDRPDWPGHYLKFHCDNGEIDFLSAPLQTTPGYSVEVFRGRKIALETMKALAGD